MSKNGDIPVLQPCPFCKGKKYVTKEEQPDRKHRCPRCRCSGTIPLRGFIILHDALAKKTGETSTRENLVVSLEGRELTREEAQHFPVRFRAYDDDDEMHFEGRCTDDETDPRNPGFEDLWLTYEWLQQDSGITYLKVQNPGASTWEQYP